MNQSEGTYSRTRNARGTGGCPSRQQRHPSHAQHISGSATSTRRIRVVALATTALALSNGTTCTSTCRSRTIDLLQVDALSAAPQYAYVTTTAASSRRGITSSPCTSVPLCINPSHTTSKREPLSNEDRLTIHDFAGTSKNTEISRRSLVATMPAKNRRQDRRTYLYWSRIEPRKNAIRIVFIATALFAATALFLSSPALAIMQRAVNSGTSSATSSSSAAAVAVAAELSAERLAAASSTSCPTALSRPLGTLRVLPTKAEIDVSIRLLAASLGGAAVGLERSSSDRPAGVRTMALVSLGAAAFTVCSMYGFLSVASSVSGAKFDPSRMASNVASGVGFIGAGVITNNRKAAGVYDRQSSVNGLTTAAAIWVSAAVGVACGVGLFVVGAAAALSTIAILRFGRVKNTGLGKGVLSIGTKRKKNTSASASTPASISRPTTSSSNATASLLNATSVSLSGKVGAEAPAALDPLLKAAKKRTPLAVAGDGLAARLMRDLVPSGANKDNSPPKSTGETLVREKSVEETRAPSTQEAGIDSAVKKKTGMKSNSTLPSRLDRGQRKVTEKRSQKLVDPLLEKYLWGDDGEERKEPATTFEGLPIPPYVPPTSFPESGAPADAEYEGAGQEMVNARRRPAPNGGGRSSGASEKLSDSG
mmetsp:Transcript_17541/g.38343  ORF Transcript_17541/g.38343 Transcript_17541/m.38343 type:complete len:651 (+) Transcript_17541:188-2140(+)